MFKKFLDINPKIFPAPEYDIKPEAEWYGVKAMLYEGAEFGGKKTRVFAYYGYPEMKEGEKVPAMVLVHGGGGHAFAEWIKRWNAHGFAAIAMDLRGYISKDELMGLTGTEKVGDDEYKRMPETDEYSAMPDDYSVYRENGKTSDLWLYQSIANVIFAHNILRNDPKIDSSRIGITGISWGGVITSQVIAHDSRFAFAAPIYGSGHLNLSISWMQNHFGGKNQSRLWCVADKYPKISFPVLWTCWNMDGAFDIFPNSISYLQTKNNGAILAILNNTNHSHQHGWAMEEPYLFAKSVVCGGKKLVHPTTEPRGFSDISFEISECGENIKATIFYLTKPMEYTEESKPDYEWKTAPCTVCGKTVTGKIPSDANNYYVEITQEYEGKIYTATTSYITNL